MIKIRPETTADHTAIRHINDQAFGGTLEGSIQCQWSDVPDEAFMILIPDKEAMKNVRGVARYREEWGEAV